MASVTGSSGNNPIEPFGSTPPAAPSESASTPSAPAPLGTQDKLHNTANELFEGLKAKYPDKENVIKAAADDLERQWAAKGNKGDKLEYLTKGLHVFSNILAKSAERSEKITNQVRGILTELQGSIAKINPHDPDSNSKILACQRLIYQGEGIIKNLPNLTRKPIETELNTASKNLQNLSEQSSRIAAQKAAAAPPQAQPSPAQAAPTTSSSPAMSVEQQQAKAIQEKNTVRELVSQLWEKSELHGRIETLFKKVKLENQLKDGKVSEGNADANSLRGWTALRAVLTNMSNKLNKPG